MSIILQTSRGDSCFLVCYIHNLCIARYCNYMQYSCFAVLPIICFIITFPIRRVFTQIIIEYLYKLPIYCLIIIIIIVLFNLIILSTKH